MSEPNIVFQSVAELSSLIESKQVSPVEVTEAYLARIDDLDFKFNAYLTVCRQQAQDQAREAEASIARGEYLGPMHGIPVAVKDQLWTKGIRSTGGSRILSDFVPEEDATAVANLKKAGAVLLGKTNLSEFAITGFTHRFSTPHNPWDLDISAGGSSSGSGAATAAFLCATSLGRGHRWVNTATSSLVWAGGPKAQLGQGQPVRSHARGLVYGHHRTHITHC